MNTTPPAPDTVPALLAQRVAATPDAVAYQCENSAGDWVPVTWQAFSADVMRLRRGLHAAGLRAGDRLALIAPVSIEWELLHHAALSMGVVVVGLDGHDLPQRIADMAQLAHVAAYATNDPRTLARLDASQWQRARLLLAWGPTAALQELPELPEGQHFITRAELEAQADEVEAEPPWPVSRDEATIIFTSGTTGAPKGIAYRHDQVVLAVTAIAQAFQFVGHEGRLLCWLPLSNLFQRMVNLAGMRQGAGTYLLSDPRRVMTAVGRVSPDIFVGVPRFYEKLYQGIRDSIAGQPLMRRRVVEWAWRVGRRVSRCRLSGQPVPLVWGLVHRVADRLVLSRVRQVMGGRLRCMVTGSAPTPRYLLEEFHALGWLLLEAYGMSENVMPMAMNRMDDFRFGTVGRPLPGNQIVIGPDGGVKVQGPGLFNGYLNDGQAPAVDTEGFYATWDLGAWDQDGYLYLTGRAGDLIKTSVGRRIAPAGVESHLRRVPGVDDALLIGNGRKYVVALCSCPELQPDETSLAAFRKALGEHLAHVGAQDRPRGVALVLKKFGIDTGELTSNLKVRRQFVISRYEPLIDRLYDAVDAAPGSGESQEQVILISP